MPERRQLATAEQVGEFLQKPIGTLQNWRYRGVGPRYIKLAGGGVRYDWRDVEAWVEQAKAAA